MGISRMNRGTFRRWRTTLLNWLLPRRAFKFFLRDWDPLAISIVWPMRWAACVSRVAYDLSSCLHREGGGSRLSLPILTTNPSVLVERCWARARQAQASLRCS